MRRLHLIALTLAACEPSAEAPGDGGRCLINVASAPTLGERGQVGLGYFPAASESLDRAMAAHGAHTNLLAFARIATPTVEDVGSTRPEVATFKLASVATSLCQHQYLITVSSGSTGVAELVLVDGVGNEVDRAPILVEPTQSLELDRGWSGDAGPTIIAGTLQGLHATTVGQGSVLVGTGAVRFSLFGTLSHYPDPTAQPPWWGGDSVTFTGTAGTGVVSADADAAHVEVPVSVVDAAAITAWSVIAPGPARVADGADVRVTALLGDEPVFGAQCVWTWPVADHPPLWAEGGWIGGPTTTRYHFTVEKAGSYRAVCTLPDASMRSVELIFD